MYQVRFTNIITRKNIKDLPDEVSAKYIRAGRLIRIHSFLYGWRYYLVIKVKPGQIYTLYVLRLY